MKKCVRARAGYRSVYRFYLSRPYHLLTLRLPFVLRRVSSSARSSKGTKCAGNASARGGCTVVVLEMRRLGVV